MKKLAIFVYNRKTSITGFLLVVVGALQANSSVIQQLATPEQYAWFTVGAGCLVAALGFVNAKKPTIPPK